MKVAVSAVFVAVVLLAVAVIAPVSGKGCDDSFDRVPRTVSVGETGIFDAFYESDLDLSDCRIDDQGCKIYSVSVPGDDIFSDGSQEDVRISISVSPANDISVSTLDGDLCLGTFHFEPVIDAEGNIIDLLLDSGEYVTRASDYLAGVENHFFPAIVIGGAGVLYLALIAAIAACAILVLEDGTNIALEFPKINLANKFYKYTKIVDGIYIVKFRDKIVGVEINGTKYNFSDDYKNKTDKTPGKYYFTYVMKDRLYIFPKEINKVCAKKIMALEDDDNAGGRYSVFTRNQSDAYDIAYQTKLSQPMGPEIHGRLSDGRLYHYHTNAHATLAHAFFAVWGGM